MADRISIIGNSIIGNSFVVSRSSRFIREQDLKHYEKSPDSDTANKFGKIMQEIECDTLKESYPNKIRNRHKSNSEYSPNSVSIDDLDN